MVWGHHSQGQARMDTHYLQMEWPPDIKAEVLRTNTQQLGNITNSDIEMAGLLLLFLFMEMVCELGAGCHVALFSNNDPTVHLVRCMAPKGSCIVEKLLRGTDALTKNHSHIPSAPLY